jgi:drug/metabolite transporter superfamily protein YnfA
VEPDAQLSDTVDQVTIALGFQLGVTAAFVVGMTVIHRLGLLGITRALRLKDDRLKEQAFDVRAVWLMARLGLFVFLLHLFEIVIFGAFYLVVGGVETVEEALYFSASAYATLGHTDEYFPQEWRLIGAVEALIGFILIGWSTAFMVSTMRKLIE